jgi:hypothetical protein
MEDKVYLQYAELYSEIVSLRNDLSEKERAIEEMKSFLQESSDECVAIEFTAHALANISERLTDLANAHHQIYEDVMNTRSVKTSLLWPANMKAFIISMIANAHGKGQFKKVPSKNTGGHEYKYDIEIKKWADNDKVIIFTAIVENRTIKTGYFNWVENR